MHECSPARTNSAAHAQVAEVETHLPDEMSDAELLACTEALQKSYPNDISEDIMNEVALLKLHFQQY